MIHNAARRRLVLCVLLILALGSCLILQRGFMPIRVSLSSSAAALPPQVPTVAIAPVSTRIAIDPIGTPIGMLALRTSSIQEGTIASVFLQQDVPFRIYVPPEYDAPENARRAYPVLYLLHGAPGGYRDWTDAAGLQSTADQLIAQGVLPPLLIVTPDGNYGALGDSQWVNGNTAAGFGRVEDFVVDEALPAIDQRYRTIADRAHRAIGGLSAGAYGAFNIAVRHPELFSIVAIHSGFYRAQPIDDGTDLFEGNQTEQDANSPIEHLDDVAAPVALAIYFDVGRADPWFVDDAEELDQALTARGIPHEFHEFAGGHTWAYWSAHVTNALRFVGAHLPHA